jgi:hypothetical protein
MLIKNKLQAVESEIEKITAEIVKLMEVCEHHTVGAKACKIRYTSIVAK